MLAMHFMREDAIPTSSSEHHSGLPEEIMGLTLFEMSWKGRQSASESGERIAQRI